MWFRLVPDDLAPFHAGPVTVSLPAPNIPMRSKLLRIAFLLIV